MRALPGSTFFANRGDPTDLPRESYLDLAVEWYGEYGITEEWTVIGQFTPIGFAQLGDQGTPYTGVYQVGLRRRLLRGRHNLAVQIDVGITPPLGETELYVDPPVGADGIEYRYVPTQSGARGDVQLGYGVGLGRAWGLMLTLAVHQHVTRRPDTNLAGSGQTDYVGFRLEFEITFGTSGWGVSAGGAGAFSASANEASPATIPLSVTHTSVPAEE